MSDYKIVIIARRKGDLFSKTFPAFYLSASCVEDAQRKARQELDDMSRKMIAGLEDVEIEMDITRL